jgi:ribosomal protein S18 acetylase RimI-like enzyme
MTDREIHVRRAHKQDVAFLRDCTRDAYARYLPILGREPEPMTLDYASALKYFNVWIATDGVQSLGLLMMTLEKPVSLIYSIAVLPEAQRQGVGKTLLTHAERAAVDLVPGKTVT